jgi:hypothetical protein
MEAENCFEFSAKFYQIIWSNIQETRNLLYTTNREPEGSYTQGIKLVPVPPIDGSVQNSLSIAIFLNTKMV